MHDTTTSFLRPIPLWFGMIGAPIVWTIHLLAVWGVTEFGCRLGLGDSTFLSVNSLRVLVLVISVIAIAITVYTGLVSYRNWQQLKDRNAEQNPLVSRGVQRGYFMAVTGMVFSGLFTLVLIYMTVPMLILTPC